MSDSQLFLIGLVTFYLEHVAKAYFGFFAQASPIAQNTLLKAKMAAFQSSFKTLDETEEKGIHISDTRK